MKRGLLAATLVSSVVLAAEPTRNSDIISLAKAGLSTAVMLEKVAERPCDFDTSTQGLIDLKTAGVPDAVIEAIVRSRCGEAPNARLGSLAPVEAPEPRAQPTPPPRKSEVPFVASRASPSRELQLLSEGSAPRFLLEMSPRTGKSQKFHIRAGFWGTQGKCPDPSVVRNSESGVIDMEGRMHFEGLEEPGMLKALLKGTMAFGSAAGGRVTLGPSTAFNGHYIFSRFGHLTDSSLSVEGLGADTPSAANEQQILETPRVPVGVGARWQIPNEAFSPEKLMAGALEASKSDDVAIAENFHAQGESIRIVEVREISADEATLTFTDSTHAQIQAPGVGSMELQGGGGGTYVWRKNLLFGPGMSTSNWIEIHIVEENAGQSTEERHCTVLVGSTL